MWPEKLNKKCNKINVIRSRTVSARHICAINNIFTYKIKKAATTECKKITVEITLQKANLDGKYDRHITFAILDTIENILCIEET